MAITLLHFFPEYENRTLYTIFSLDNRQDIPQLRNQMQKYTKGIFTKMRKMATHLLIFMISEEKRDKKPYAVPVRILPVTTVNKGCNKGHYKRNCKL